MIGIGLLIVLAVTTYLVAAEGAWGAATTLVAAVVAGLLATSYFEPLAGQLDAILGVGWQGRNDLIAFLGLFAGLVTLLRLGVEKIQPAELDVEGRAYDAVRWLAGLGCGYVMCCVAAVGLHLAPMPRTYQDFRPEPNSPVLLGIASPDYQWLGYCYRLSLGPYQTGSYSQPTVFDGSYYKTAPSEAAQYFPDLPIRYAWRREQYAGGIVPSAAGGGTAGPSFPPPRQPGSSQGRKAF